MAFIETRDEPDISEEVRAMYARAARALGLRAELRESVLPSAGDHGPVGAAASWHQAAHGQAPLRARDLRGGSRAAQHPVHAGSWQGAGGNHSRTRRRRDCSRRHAFVAVAGRSRHGELRSGRREGRFEDRAADVDHLRQHGFTDAEIFDIVATAAARSFWTKVIESLGVEAEPPFRELSPEFSSALVCGRPVTPTSV